MTHTMKALRGWRLTGWLAALAVALPFSIVAVHGWNEGAVLVAARMTARLSVTLFVLAFGASALMTFWPNGFTRWLRSNRRYVGVAFALAHGVHLSVLVARGLAFPEHFVREQDPLSLAAGTLAYGFILLMAATSFDRTATWLGPRWWRRLHLVGGWYVWLIFVESYALLAWSHLAYLPQVVVLLALGALRVARHVRRPSKTAQG